MPDSKIITIDKLCGFRDGYALKNVNSINFKIVNWKPLLAPAVTVGETEGAMDSTSVFFLASSFAYNFVRK